MMNGRVKGETRRSMQIAHPMLLERGYVVKELLGLGAEGDVVRAERMRGPGGEPRSASQRVSMRLSGLLNMPRMSSEKEGNSGTVASGQSSKRDSNVTPRSKDRSRWGSQRLGSQRLAAQPVTGTNQNGTGANSQGSTSSLNAQATLGPAISQGRASSVPTYRMQNPDQPSVYGVIPTGADASTSALLSSQPNLSTPEELGIDAPTSVAVKIITRAYAERENCEAAVIREIDILRHARHPNIVLFVECFENAKHWYLVTEILRGGDLFDAAIRKTFTEIHAIDIAIQIFSALDYLHTRGVAHRDVKLENLVYTKAKGGEIKLIDFGLAWRRDDHVRRVLADREKAKKYRKKKKDKAGSSSSSDAMANAKEQLVASEFAEKGTETTADGRRRMILSSDLDSEHIETMIEADKSLLLITDEFPGSSAYESPEIVLRKPHHAEPLDIWSTGVVLYALIKKKFPFTGDTRKQVQKAIVYKEPPFDGQCWKETSEEFKSFLRQILHKDPSQRPTARECAEFFRAVKERKESGTGGAPSRGDSQFNRKTKMSESRLMQASSMTMKNVGASFRDLGHALKLKKKQENS
ncbi:Calcium-dependent protein kinase 3 [Porphyridium purpureum]|uniref:Calcium-dependent protein kinase 3 n=1 Tax=Porphyridium purpureum TaxID=35688 RepID=A0A5J4YY37_PORPP|nr:Calcium-dependent protein kinase 3 [Porphyridium purpureum]|eukprot:POR9051..scf209_3